MEINKQHKERRPFLYPPKPVFPILPWLHEANPDPFEEQPYKLGPFELDDMGITEEPLAELPPSEPVSVKKEAIKYEFDDVIYLGKLFKQLEPSCDDDDDDDSYTDSDLESECGSDDDIIGYVHFGQYTQRVTWVDISTGKRPGHEDNISLKSEDLWDSEQGLDDFVGEFVEESLSNIVETMRTEVVTEIEEHKQVGTEGENLVAKEASLSGSYSNDIQLHEICVFIGKETLDDENIDEVHRMKGISMGNEAKMSTSGHKIPQKCKCCWLFSKNDETTRPPTFSEYLNDPKYDSQDVLAPNKNGKDKKTKKTNKRKGLSRLASVFSVFGRNRGL